MSGANYIILSSQLSCQVTLGALHALGRSYRKSWNEVEWRPPAPAATLTNTKQSDNIAILHYLLPLLSIINVYVTHSHICIYPNTRSHITSQYLLFYFS